MAHKGLAAAQWCLVTMAAALSSGPLLGAEALFSWHAELYP